MLHAMKNFKFHIFIVPLHTLFYNVKIAFLNGYIKEDIFMEQPKAFESKESSKLCNIDLSMVSSKLQRVGIIVSMRLSVLMVSLRMRMSHVFTRRLVGACSLPGLVYG